MHTTTFKINWDFVSRLFIGLLFVYAGYTKIMDFGAFAGHINNTLGTGSLSPVLAIVAIFIEIVVAILYIWGKYKKDLCAYVLITFTALTTVLFHSFIDPVNTIASLKNIAIIGGLFATLDAVHKRRNS
jgi:uncharacterized membrane protein YphA (DoxX/SURF4 family)